MVRNFIYTITSLGLFCNREYIYVFVLHFTDVHGVLQQGITVYNLEGSLFKWANEGKPMVDINNRVTVYVHPYNAIWGKLLEKKLQREEPSSEHQTP